MADSMTLTDAVDRLKDLASRTSSGFAEADYDDGIAIDLVLRELRSQLDCPSCHGQKRRWYALYGMDTCHECHGTGEKR